MVFKVIFSNFSGRPREHLRQQNQQTSARGRWFANVVGTGVDPVTYRFSGDRSAN